MASKCEASPTDQRTTFSVVRVGCCNLWAVYIASNKTGQVLPFPLGGEDNLSLQTKYELNSMLIVAQWTDYQSRFLEYLSWKDQAVTPLAKQQIGASDVCYDDISDTIARERATAAPLD